MKYLNGVRLAALMVALTGLSPVQANITGSINANITLQDGCTINGSNPSNGASGVSFGTLNFGPQTTLFAQVDSQVIGAAGGIAVQCTVGVSPVLVIGAGQFDGLGANGLRAMLNLSVPGNYVGYNLYRDPSRTQVIAPGDSITLLADGSPQLVQVFGRAFGASGLNSGTYTDLVTVTLEL